MNKNEQDRSKTAPLSADPEVVKQHLPPRAALLIYHREGNTVVTLSPGDSIVVGRNRPADVVIADHTVSRRHAQFAFDGRTVTLADLGSSNGTMVNDAPLTGTAVVEPGDHILIGNVVVALMLLPQGERRPRGLDNHERLLEGLKDDLERARHFGSAVSLLLVSAREDGVHVGAFASDVQTHLRPVDRAALLSPTILEVHLKERTAAEARVVADEITAAHKGVVVGIASYPELCQGRADAMIEGARMALAVARKKGGTAMAEKALVRVVDEKVPPVVVNPAMKRLFDEVAKFARSSMPVLIRGETGSGKEVVARALHEGGPRMKAPMISVNCGALPQHLVESTLFGHIKGAFTGADRDQVGVFESADGGTVFLDEIGELPANAQATLLRVLESKVITRLGAPHKEIKVDVRIVAATHRDLEEMCGEGTFRTDLRYRLEGNRFDVPALRARSEEVLALAKRFLRNATDNHHIEGIDDDATAALLAYDWPGNVRELKNAVERAVVVAAGPNITLADLPEAVRRAVPTSRGAHTGLHRLDDIPLARDEDSRPQKIAAATVTDDADDESASADLDEEADGGLHGEGADYKSRMRTLEAKVLIEALERNNGVQVAAARDLQMPVRTLVHKLKVLGIKRDKGKYVHE